MHLNHFAVFLQLNESSSYYFLPTCLPIRNKMYLECGDCCQQTIISCGNDLARVSNKSPQTDSLTCEIFVPRIQIKDIVLSRNTPAEKCCDLLINNNNNSHKLSYIAFLLLMVVQNHFICLLRFILSILKKYVIFLDSPRLIFNWGAAWQISQNEINIWENPACIF